MIKFLDRVCENLFLILALVCLWYGAHGLAAFNVAWACYIKIGRVSKKPPQ